MQNKLDGTGAGAGSLPEDKEERNESIVSSGPRGPDSSARSWGNGRNSDFSPIPTPSCPLRAFLNLVQESLKKPG